jgi:ribosomal protein S18 acetylase RimI-like enzyme
LLEIRPATPDLAPHIKAAIQQTFDWHQEQHPYAFPDVIADLLETKLEFSFCDPKGKPVPESQNLWTAHFDDVFAGYVLLDLKRGHDATFYTVTIDDIWVAPTYRRQGIGTALLAEVKSFVDAEGADNLSAKIWHGNAASFRLFQSAGFEVQCQTVRYGPMRKARSPSRKTKTPSFLERFAFALFAFLFLTLSGLLAWVTS